MAEITVKAFAEQIGVSTDRLIAQFAEAGVEGISKPSDQLSSEQKMKLLTHLRKVHGGESQAEPRRVTLKRRSVSELKVAGTQGRAKTVNVEVRRKRTYVKRAAVMEQERERVEQEQARRAADEAQRAAAVAAKEREAALEKKQKEEAAAAQKREEERKEREAVEQREMLIRQQEEERRRAEAEAKREEEEEQRRQERALSGKGAKGGNHGKNNKPSSEKLHVKTGGRARKAVRDRGTRHGRVADVESQHVFEKPVEPKKIEVEVPEAITAGELAQRMAVKSSELIRALMKLGVMATINQTLDQDTAVLVVEEMGHIAKLQAPQDAESALLEKLSGPQGEEKARYPVVTVMGHVDHGKTSLLDYIRSTRVTAKEAGGITQHIGAYHVPLKEGGVTFLDTPGHAAFTSMRARGTQVTDIVILVVAADDGVMPQTVEAIEHARSGGVPIVVAVNKIDKPEADQERVKNELSQRNVIPEEWGGDTQFVPISAKTGEGVDALLEAVHLQAELLELKARVAGPARGVVLEASLDKGRGAVATVLVQQGTLHRGDILLAGSEFGRVRALLDENGRQVKAAGPSIPVQVLGLSSTPTAGEEAVVVPDEKTAREVASFRQQRERGVRLAAQQPTRLNEMFSKLDQSERREMRLVIKADVHGSLEAIRDAVSKFSTDEVSVKVISSGVGAITESDVNLAMASDAVIIGFNVRADSVARRAQQEGGVDVRYYSVIYELIDDVRKALSGMLSPELKEEIIGNAEVKDVFQSPKFGAVAGCLVTDGVVRKDNPIRVLRDNVVIFEGQLESLRRFKDNVAEVRAGTECGIAVKDYKDVRPGDQIEVFQRIEVEREIEV